MNILDLLKRTSTYMMRFGKLVILVPILPFVFSKPSSAQLYASYRSGSTVDVSPPIESALLLAGGGEDIDDGLRWLLQKGGNGDVVVLRASGADGYNSWFMDHGANSVETIVFYSRSPAYDEDLLERIKKAEVVFLAGGDQSRYVNFWRDTPLASILNQKTVVGGTSAGLAVMGEFVYSAQFESAQSSEVLLDPFHGTVTLDKDVFDFRSMKNILTDSHFSQRQREGRLAAFLARIIEANWSKEPLGLGIDEETSVGIDLRSDVTVFGNGNAYLYDSVGSDVETCEAGKAVTIRNIHIKKLTTKSTFNLQKKVGENYSRIHLDVVNGELKFSAEK